LKILFPIILVFFSLLDANPIFTNEQIEKLEQKAYSKYKNNNDFKKVIEPNIKNLALQYWQNEILKEIKISEKETKNWYSRNKGKIKVLPQIRLRNILVDNKLAATDLFKRLSATPMKERLSSFLYAVNTYSKDGNKKNGGDNGWLTSIQFQKLFNVSLASKKAGDLFVVKNNFGWQVVLVEAKKPQKIANYNEAKEEIENILKREKLFELLKKQL
jgi:parvulin-like peptidyl-prolyl isomerase